ncbi:MAG: hypothetical protein ABIU05_16890 [Nitrospirales bacterium]
MTPLSMNKIAQVFGKDRATLYSWIRRGCPCVPPEGPGKPARMDFKTVLKWRKAHWADRKRWSDHEHTTAYLTKMEAEVRERLQALKARRP